MPSISETLNSQNELASELALGIDVISQSQEVTFQKYIRVVLPLDGFVFWIKPELLSASAILNASILNSSAINSAEIPLASQPISTIVAKGSVHYSTARDQREDETIDVNSVIFTTTEDLDGFNDVAQGVMYIASFDGLQFAFNKRQALYKQAGVYHYHGDAVYPAMRSQIIDDIRAFDSLSVVTSNSLPIWLSLTQFMPIYPSHAVPTNILPPYAVAHIPPDSTNAMQSAPTLDQTLTHSQLVRETVKITIYGLRNFNALDFQDYVLQYSLDSDAIGIMNIPVIRDEKRTQSEISVLAMKKSIEFDVNYYQGRVQTVARQLILSVVPTFYPQLITAL